MVDLCASVTEEVELVVEPVAYTAGRAEAETAACLEDPMEVDLAAVEQLWNAVLNCVVSSALLGETEGL